MVVLIDAAGFQGDVLSGEPGFHLDPLLGLYTELTRYRLNLGGREGLEAGFQTAQIEEQLALRFGRGDLDQPPVAQYEFVNLRLDPVDRERHQAHAAVRIKALDRLHEADIAFLDQIGMRKPVPP